MGQNLDEYIEYYGKMKYSDDSDSEIVKLLENVRKIIKNKEIGVIYPKNLHIKGQKIRLYIFLKDYLIYSTSDSYNINTEVYSSEDVKKLEEIIDKETGNSILRITFSSGDKLTLNNNLDTIKEYSGEFKKYIDNIISFLYDEPADK